MGTRKRAEEEWAQRIVEKELKQTVVVNDDGSAPGMYDLRIGPPDVPEIAIECIRAVDPIFIETWKIGPAKGSMKLSISGDWTVVIAPTARVNIVRQHIEQILQVLESRGIYDVLVEHELKRYDPVLFNTLNSVNIVHAYCYQQPGTGKVYLTMPGNGGAVDEHGIALPDWVGEFLRDSARQDVLSKLQRSGAAQRHAFLIVTFTGASWAVESYLSGTLNHLPSQAPDLPTPVTGVWVVLGGGQRGVRWDGDIWKLFDAHGEGIED